MHTTSPSVDTLGYAIEATNLRKRYGSVVALDGLTFRVRYGEVYALVGPNGAGKTTTLKILAGLLKPDSGRARVCGFDVVKERVAALRSVGYVPENPVAFQNLSVEDLLRFIAALRGLDRDRVMRRASYYLELFGLWSERSKLVKELSRGMLQKVLVAAAMLVEPKVLVMDEPMAGMDPESQHVFKREVRRLASEGVCVLISSHILEVVEKLCDRVGLIHKGKLLLEGSVEEVKSKAAAGSLEEAFLKLVGIRGS